MENNGKQYNKMENNRKTWKTIEKMANNGKQQKKITVNNADKFTFNLGGNISSGEEGTNLTFQEFVNLFDIDLLSLDSNITINSDFYI